MMREIAIIGGGPAGALCGERLAQAGFRVTLFDEHVAWEKPCGGGLTYKAMEAYPFLLDGPQPKKVVRTCELIASDGQRARLTFHRPMVVYSRQVLNGLLLERAAAAGCTVVRARVTRVTPEEDRVRLAVNGSWHSADFVVVAAGARWPGGQPSSRFSGIGAGWGPPLQAQDLELTAGYFVPVEDDVMKVRFLAGFTGYLWSFPRAGHLSVGICGAMGQTTSAELKQRLDDFMQAERIPTMGAQFYSHILPAPRAATLRTRRVAGPGWALVGDAAAYVDPITGEGIYYAMRSGELLAESLARGEPEQYPARVRAAFAADLERSAHIAPRFYHGHFLGGAVTTRMVQFARHSPTFRALLRDLFSGAQDYRSLKRRLWGQLGITLAEIAASALRPALTADAEARP